MKITKTSEIDRAKAFRVFRVIGDIFLTKNDPNKVIFAVGATHKKMHEIMSLSTSLPVEVISAKTIRAGFWWFVPLPCAIKFIIRINDSSCISELATQLDLFLLIGIYSIDAKLTSDFIITAQSNASLERLVESGNGSLGYAVDFDNQESETDVMEYWMIYDSSLASELALYL